jgi:hypothetical protein
METRAELLPVVAYGDEESEAAVDVWPVGMSRSKITRLKISYEVSG